MNPLIIAGGAVIMIIGCVMVYMAKQQKDQTTGKYKAMLGMGIVMLLAGIGMAGYGVMSTGAAAAAAAEEVAKTEIPLNAEKAAIKGAPNAASTDAIVEANMTKQAEIASQIQSVAAAKIAAAQNAANKTVANATAAAQAEAAARSTKLQQNLALVQAAGEAHKQALQLQAQAKAAAAQAEAGAGIA